MKIFEKINNASVDYAHEAVPTSERRGPLALFLVWFVVMINLIFIFFGVNISRGMPLGEALLACVVGQALAGLMLAITAIFSGKVNMSAGQLMPYVFGKKPGMVIMFALGLMGIAWFGFQLELFSQSLSRLVGLEENQIKFVVAISGLFMISSGVIGFKAIDWVSRIATPFLVILLAFPTVEYFMNGNTLGSLFDTKIDVENTIEFGTAVSVLLGGLAVPLLITADIMRYARNATQSFWTTFVAQTFGAISIIVLAILLGRISSEPDFISIIAAAGFGGFGLILIMLATWTTNDTNIYISSLAYASIFKTVKKWKIAFICGIAGICVGMLGIVEHFMQMLSLLGVFFGPAGAIFQIGIFMRMHKMKFTEENYKKDFDWNALVALVIGCGASLMTNAPENLGFGLLSLTTIPMIDGYLAAGISYYALMKLHKEKT